MDTRVAQSKTYPQRLAELNLQSLEERRQTADLVFMHKLVYCQIELDVRQLFEMVHQDSGISGQNSRTMVRSHPLKVVAKNPVGPDFRFIDCRQKFFSNRVANPWNQLPQDLVLNPNSKSFKQQLCISFKELF